MEFRYQVIKEWSQVLIHLREITSTSVLCARICGERSITQGKFFWCRNPFNGIALHVVLAGPASGVTPIHERCCGDVLDCHS